MDNQLIADENIMNKIYYIRGQKIMLASGLNFSMILLTIM